MVLNYKHVQEAGVYLRLYTRILKLGQKTGENLGKIWFYAFISHLNKQNTYFYIH